MRKLLVIGSWSFMAIILAAPFVAFALQMQSIWPTGYWADKGFVGCSGLDVVSSGGTTTLGPNNCNAKGLCGLVQVLLNVIAFGASIVFFVLAPIFFTWGGIKILTSSGNPTGLEEGKKIFKGTLIGVLLVLAGFLIVKTIVTTLNVGDFIQGFTNGISC